MSTPTRPAEKRLLSTMVEGFAARMRAARSAAEERRALRLLSAEQRADLETSAEAHDAAATPLSPRA